MGLDKEAKVTATLGGVDEVVSGAERVKSAWSGAGASVTSAFGSAGSSISGALSTVVQDVGHVITALASVNMVTAVGEVRKFESAIADLAPMVNKSFGDTQDLVLQTAKNINETKFATEGWMESVGRLTNSYDQLAERAKKAKEYAQATGQPLSSTIPFIGSLSQITGPGAGPEMAMAEIRRQAGLYNTPGGPKAVQDIVAAIAPMAAKMGGQTPENLIEFAAAINPKGTPAERMETAVKLVTELAGTDAIKPQVGYRKNLGRDVRDNFGHAIDILDFAKSVQGRVFQTRGEDPLSSSGTELMLRSSIGDVATQGLMSTQWKKYGASFGVRLRNNLEERIQSDVGQYEQDTIEGEIVLQKKFAHDTASGAAQTGLHKLSTHYPALTSGVLGVMTNLGARALKTGAAGADAAKVPAALSAIGKLFSGGATEAAPLSMFEGAIEPAVPVIAGTTAAAGMMSLGAATAGVTATLGVLHTLGEGSSPEAQGLKVKAITGSEAANIRSMNESAQSKASSIRAESGMDHIKHLTAAAKEMRDAAAALKAQAGKSQVVTIKDKTSTGIQQSNSDNLLNGRL